MAVESDSNQNWSVFSVKIITSEHGDMSIEGSDVILFEMVEDIFSACIVAKLVFYDSVGSLEMIPITGNELVAIVYGKDQTTVLFSIYDFKKVHQTTQSDETSSTMVEMFLVEPVYLALTQYRYSKSWINTKISDIVKDICTNMLKITVTDEFQEWEDSTETLDYFYMPYWTPLEAIKWLMARGSGSKTSTAGYLFYSNTQGYNFHTIENLFTSKTFDMNDDGSLAKYVFADNQDMQSVTKVLSWYLEPINIQSVPYLCGGHRLGYDFATKELIDYSYEYKDVISKYTMMGKKTLFEDISRDTSQIIFDGDNSEALLKNIAYSDVIKRYTKQFAACLVVRGHDRRYAGMLIDIPWKSVAKTEMLHKLYEGKWLVRSITHQFSGRTQPYYKQLLVVVKTGYTDADQKELYAAPKYDITVPEK